MRFNPVRVLQHGVAGVTLVLCIQPSLIAQPKVTTSVSVPVVGCRSDGQVGPKEAPRAAEQRAAISPTAARGLAYYESATELGVLGPRGWNCFGTYGSNGDALFVSPEPVDTANVFSASFAGPAIEISRRSGDTSGRFDVAQIIARVFPEYRAFATSVMKQFNQSFQFGPFPRDTLTYKSKSIVEYTTPAQTDGLGTYSALKKTGSPIAGVAILTGQTPDLLFLAVRLPPDLTGLTPVIVGQVERDAVH